MNKNIFWSLLVALFGGLLLSGCEKWEKHNAVTDPAVGKDLFQRIQENTDLSKFAELLTKTGYDKIIASSQTYTVFAPVNAALATLDPAIVSDAAKLKLFVENHITNQLQPSTTTAQVRVQMLSGKYNNLQNAKFDDASITKGDQYAKNGLLHIIDKMVPVLSNAWQFLESSPQMPSKQKAFLLSLTDSTGLNSFLRNVYDLRDERKQYTFFVLTDTTWDAEVNAYKPFFVTGTTDSTNRLAANAVVNDFAVEGVYQPATIPDTILSKFNTKVGIDKSAIVQTIKVSNGIVYLMKKLPVLPKHKFRQYMIQGENYDFSRADKRSVTYFRDKFNPVTQADFTDVLVFNHDIAQFYLGYRLRNVPSMKFKAYWVAVHDNINANTGTFRQMLGIGTFAATTLPYI
ncbi:MAG: fasciclin domain-containing protein, partial [Chitinophagaceae bacterium]